MSIRLVVQGDDFGMCHAVNQGTMIAYRDGILTQTSTMSSCPWFGEAVTLAHESGIPLGVHQTLTCEWDHLRWRPLTDGPSLVDSDGTFFRTVAGARASITHADAVRELTAQAQKFADAGLPVGYLDIHMGESAPDAYAEVSAAVGKPYIYGPVESKRFASIDGLSQREPGEKKPWMLNYLAGLTSGVHLLVTHSAVAGPEIASIHRPGNETFRWAEEYRISDLAVLIDPQIRQAIEERGIELLSVAEAF